MFCIRPRRTDISVRSCPIFDGRGHPSYKRTLSPLQSRIERGAGGWLTAPHAQENMQTRSRSDQRCLGVMARRQADVGNELRGGDEQTGVQRMSWLDGLLQ